MPGTPCNVAPARTAYRRPGWANGSGWADTGKVDICGCGIWTAPGMHACEKSATAHEPDCAVWVDSPDPPLHIWTDHSAEPFEFYRNGDSQFTVSRLQAEAAIHFNNDMGAAMDDLDLGDDLDLHGDPDTLDAGTNGQTRGDPAGTAALGPAAISDPTADAIAQAKAELAQRVRAADELFDHTALLNHIAMWADARGSSQVAVLVQVLMQTSLVIPPCVVIPAHLGGDHVGLSLLAALTGAPSGGKGRAEAVGRDAIKLQMHGEVRRFEPIAPATGEGLVSLFADTQRNTDTWRVETRIHTPGVLLSFKDITTFGSLVSRSGETLCGNASQPVHG